MPKVCTVCGGKHYAKGFCAIHYKMPSQINPKPIKRKELTTDRKMTSVKRAPIKKVADKRAKELREYAKICGPFKLDNPFCHARVKGCTHRTTDIHHMKGRENSMLLKVEYFLPVCRNCHDWIGDNHTLAKEMGFSINRIIA